MGEEKQEISARDAASPDMASPGASSPPRQWPRKERNIVGKVDRRKVLTRWLKRGILGAVALGAAALIVVASLPKPLSVDVATVQKGEMTVTVDEAGRARVKDRYIVSAPLSGRMERLELNAGDNVKQGQVLLRIVPLAPPLLDDRRKSSAEARILAAKAARRQSAAQIARAKAALAFSDKLAARTEKLVREGVSPQQKLDEVLLQQRSAKAEVESLRFGARVASYELQMAQAALGHIGKKSGGDQLEVPAPVDGRVLKVMHQSEGVIAAGTPLLELGSPEALEIVVDVLTSDAVRIRPGAAVMVDRWGGEPLAAQVRMVEPSAFTRLSALGVEEQRVNVLLDVHDPYQRWAALGDGYRVEAHIEVWKEPQVLKVPASAVFRAAGKWSIFEVEGALARLREVEIGQRNGREVQLLSGIKPEAKIILHPSDQIHDGSEVVAR